jgi:hypothetical protein
LTAEDCRCLAHLKTKRRFAGYFKTFDVSDPFKPSFIAQIPLGELALSSGKLRNKKSINLVYVRPGARSQTA